MSELVRNGSSGTGRPRVRPSGGGTSDARLGGAGAHSGGAPPERTSLVFGTGRVDLASLDRSALHGLDRTSGLARTNRTGRRTETVRYDWTQP